MKIDLSKKPEGATHINPHSGLWVKCFGGNSGSYQFFRNGEWEMGFGCMSNSYLEIAQPEPWTGEGLPPVGTVCEFAGFNPEETTFDDPAVGDKVTVIAHYLSGCVQVAAFTYNCASNFGSLNVAQGAHGCFRHIRTPEQIESDKRISEIHALSDELAGYEGVDGARARHHNMALYLVDQGYRKQVTE